jgi:flagellar biosynthesis protein FlhG
VGNKEQRTVDHIITVGGGKGGVGKSLVALNLAAACAAQGRRVVIADMDLGASNQHLLLNITAPKPGVQALLDPSVTDLRDALTPTSVPNVSLLAGRGAVLGAANITYNEKRRLLRKLRSLDALVIVDVGAGVGYNNLDFFLLGHQRLLVTTPQVTSVHDAYSFLKGAVLRTIQQHAEKELDAAVLEPILHSSESEKVSALFARLAQQRPDLAKKIRDILSGFNAYMVGNQVADRAQVRVFASVAKMMRDYLDLDVPVLGWVPHSSRVHDSVNLRRPLLDGPACEETRTFQRMAEDLLAEEVEVDDLAEADEPMPPAGPRRSPSRLRVPIVTPAQT